MGREVSLNQLPKRIVSLVPSQTELLYDLGLDSEVVGQTLFCIHPEHQFAQKTRVGGTKKLNIQKIRELKPDLIIGNKEENEQSQIEELMQEFPVWMSDIKNLAEATQMIQMIGALVGKEQKANAMAHEINQQFASLVRTETPKNVLYLIWRNPWMAAASGTFIAHMLEKMGLRALPLGSNRYPELSFEQIRHSSADIVFLSSEPYPFQDKHIQELQEALPQAQILLVDGELFSWYGSRLLKSVGYFKELQSKLL